MWALTAHVLPAEHATLWSPALITATEAPEFIVKL